MVLAISYLEVVESAGLGLEIQWLGMVVVVALKTKKEEKMEPLVNR